MIILSPQLGISPTATTGGETYDRELLKQFVRLGQDVKILLPKSKSIPVEIPEQIVDRTPISHFVPPYTFNLLSIPWVIKQIQRSTLNAQRSLILRIHSPEYLFFTGYLIKKLFPKILLVVHYHLDQTGKLWTAMNKKLLNMADAVIADSEFLKKQLIERVGIEQKKIHVIYCGVDVDSIKPEINKGLALRSKARPYKTILFLGRFIERKRPDLAIEIFAKLHAKHPDTRLIMVGEGPMEEKLKTQGSKLKILDAVEFPGSLFGKEKLKKYHEADLFLFPSEKEGFVLVVLEAMAAGLPLVVPDSLGFPEAVENGKNGYLADPGNIKDWANKAEKILYSPILQNSMRKYSRYLAETKFSWKMCAGENLKIYQSLV
ncbi:glycosyltransferase family 4 protein [Candidatus Collierbacteria bacterium]|nr:glycosyltransferase family 4 protein [Candidatus Collierbacteria bacterium]